MELTHQLLVTFSASAFFGIFFIIISNKLKIPSIVLLLLGGILLGPHGISLIHPASLGTGLNVIIQLAVALILFEGGLTLDAKGYRQVSKEIRNSLTRGIIVTWGLSSLIVKIIFHFPWPIAVLSGSLIIVTGPTVIGPLLKRVRVKKNIYNFLHWEGVLIDPIGVFIALLTYEWLVGERALQFFLFRIVVGISIGLLSGFILYFLIKKKYIQEEILNIFILSYALVIFVFADFFVPESGLLSVTIAGFILGYSKLPQLNSIKLYKAEFINLLIGLLFILLSANLNINFFWGKEGILLGVSVLAIMLIVRPINIFITIPTRKNFSIKDKLFLSWIAPRGIVAASMASLFALNLKNLKNEYSSYANFIEAFTYLVIIGTVFIQGFTANIVGRLFGVVEPDPSGWLIVGAHNFALEIASFIKKMEGV